MREKLYRLALTMAVISFLPFLVFVSRKEAPPEKIKVPQHKTQTVEKFKLEATGKNKWELIAPKATFVGKNIIKLNNPVLTIYLKNRVIIESSRAILHRDKGIVYLDNVTLFDENFKADSKGGIYDLRRQLFKTDKGCRAVYNNVNSSKGKICKIDVSEDKIVILKHVKTVIREVSK